LHFLTEQGCDLAQGYLLGRPMNADAYLSYLTNVQAGVEPFRVSVGGAGG